MKTHLVTTFLYKYPKRVAEQVIKNRGKNILIYSQVYQAPRQVGGLTSLSHAILTEYNENMKLLDLAIKEEFESLNTDKNFKCPTVSHLSFRAEPSVASYLETKVKTSNINHIIVVGELRWFDKIYSKAEELDVDLTFVTTSNEVNSLKPEHQTLVDRTLKS